MNREALLASVGGNADLLQRMAKICLEEDGPRLEATIRSVVDAADCEGVQHAAHAVQGLATAFGADALCRAAAALERNAHELTPALMRERAAHLHHELDILLQALREVAEGGSP